MHYWYKARKVIKYDKYLTWKVPLSIETFETDEIISGMSAEVLETSEASNQTIDPTLECAEDPIYFVNEYTKTEILESKVFETYILENPSKYYLVDHISIWTPMTEQEKEQVEKVKEEIAELTKLTGKHIYIGNSKSQKFFMSPEETETGIKFNCFCTNMF